MTHLEADEVKQRIAQIRNATRDDVIDKLNQHHRCIIIRPTGYGKTYLLTDLISRYKRILYLYPAEIIAETVKHRYYALYDSDVDEETVESVEAFEQMSNVTLMTYAKLIRITDDEFKAMDYDCIICDEAHREEFLSFYKGVIDVHQLTYPLQDAEKLVRYGTDGKSRMVPLQVCADAKNVSIGAILDLLGVA